MAEQITNDNSNTMKGGSHDKFYSTHVAKTTLDHILTLSQEQAKMNIRICASMNPFTSLKMGSIINQIGHLIYEQAETSDIDINQNNKIRPSSIIHELQQTVIIPKDNMFTTGLKVQEKRINQNMINASSISVREVENQRDQTISVNSFKTSFSKSIHNKVSDLPNSKNLKKKTERNHILNNNHGRIKYDKKQDVLINLRPSTKTGRTRNSAFDQNNNNYENILEKTIDQLRDQKIIEEQTRLKQIQNNNKMTTLLNKDQMIVSFNYQGDILKITKRDFNLMMQKRANSKIVESIIVPANQKFWKTKQTQKDKTLTSQNFYDPKKTSDRFQNDQKTKYSTKVPNQRQNQFKRTSIERINEMKRNSIEVTNKKVIISEQKVDFQQYKRKLKERGDSSLTHKSNKPLTEEQLKDKNNKIEFLTNKLSQYHQQPQNQLSEWIQNVENGCKMSIFIGKKKQSTQNLLINKNHQNLAHEMKQKLNKDLRSQSQPRSRNPPNLILEDEFTREIKCLSNLKSPSRQEEDLMAEWQKRKLIKTVQIRLGQRENSKTFNKNTPTSKRAKTLQSDRLQSQSNYTEKNDTKLSSPKNTKNQQKSKLTETDPCGENKSQGKTQNQQPVINLNLSEFLVLKNYIKTKNSLLQKKDSISKHRTQSILENKKKVKKQQNGGDFSFDEIRLNSDMVTLLDGKNQTEDKNVLNKKSNRNVSFLDFSQQGSTLSGNKLKSQGTITVTDQKLKNSLLGSVSPNLISPSSLLHPKRNNLLNYKKSTQKNQGKSVQIFQLHRISRSEKSILPLESQKKPLRYKQALSLQRGILTRKNLTIMQRKNYSTVVRANITPKSIK